MKILHVEDYFNPEAGYQINELLIADSNNEQILITSKDMSPFHKEYNDIQKQKDLDFEEKHKIKIIRLDVLFKIGSRIFYKNLKKTINKENPDILFLHSLGDFKDILFLYGKNNFLTFRDCHMSWVASKNKFSKLYYKFFSLFFAPFINKKRKYEKVYALGNEEKEYIKALGISDDRIAMLPHGYNENTYYQNEKLRDKTRNELRIDNNDILISYIGKFDHYKEPHVSLEIFNLLGSEFIEENNLQFLFLGPKNEEYIETIFTPKLQNFKYKDRVIILPGTTADELVDYYNASDIALWPRETTLSSIHAQVCGCIVIMEEYESNKERVVEQKYLFEIGSSKDAKNKLVALVKEVKEGKKDINLESLFNREYHGQMQNLLKSWDELLIERKQ